MEFSSLRTSRAYSDRDADTSWERWCKKEIAPVGKDVIDLGCGGGIYVRGFLACGAHGVIGVDSSKPYIKEAQQACPQAQFINASCMDTGLDSQCADVVFERAVIHHLTHGELIANAVEIRRLLKADGIAYIQDRTQEDVLAADPQYWIRRELLEMYPSLLAFEAKRRPKTEDYCAILKDCGFSNVDVLTFAETRKVYDSADALAQELRQRKGKSILYQLTDDELDAYVERVISQCPEGEVVERDQWTIWRARR